MNSRQLRDLTFLFASLCGLQAFPALAATINVPADQPTIQQAINVANNGDLILVAPGTYPEHIDYLGKAITVQSTVGPGKTIIDGQGTGTVVTFQTQEGAQSVLTGFTIQGGNALVGAGIKLSSASPKITNNIFRDNVQSVGGAGAAIGGTSSSPTIERNTFLVNTCDAQTFSGVVSFLNMSSPRIINNVFTRNPCRAIYMSVSSPMPGGIEAPPPPDPTIANNTIVRNNGGVRLQGGFQNPSQLYVNNILVGNSIGLQVDSLVTGREPTWNNNLVFLNTTNYSGIADKTGINGNISVDPLFFTNRDRLNFELQIGSPAIDAGTLSVPNLPPIDFLGNPRVVDGDGNGSALPDMGAYEFIPVAVRLNFTDTPRYVGLKASIF